MSSVPSNSDLPVGPASGAFPTAQRVFFWLRQVWTGLWRDIPGRVSTGFFNPGMPRQVAFFALACLLTILVYTWLVSLCYRETWQEYRRANVFDELRAKMSRDFEIPEQKELAKREAMLALFLQQMNLASAEETVESLKQNDPTYQKLRDLLVGDGKGEAFYSRATVDVIVDAIFNLAPGNDTPGWWKLAQAGESRSAESASEFRHKMADVVAAMLAGYPGAADESGKRSKIANFFFQPTSADAAENGRLASEAESIFKKYGPKFGTGLCNFDGLQLRLTNEPAQDEEIMRLLYHQTGLAETLAESVSVQNAPATAPLATPAPTATPAPPDAPAPTATPDAAAANAPPAPAANAAANAALSVQDLRKLDRFFSGLLTRLRSQDNVKSANWWMTLCRGYEQFCMLIIFFWMTLLLYARSARRLNEERIADELFGITRIGMQEKLHRLGIARRLQFAARTSKFEQFQPYSIAKVMLKTCIDQLKRTDHELEKTNLEELGRQLRQNDLASRWTLTWQARALPAIGFVGTVHGISYAMMGADTLVRASTPAAQAAAVNLVAGNLGVAFSHTLIALVMGILLSWFSDGQAFQERALVARLERELGYLIDPIGFDHETAGSRAAAVPATRSAALQARRSDERHRIYAGIALSTEADPTEPVEAAALLAEPLNRVGFGHLLLACALIAAVFLSFYLHPPAAAEYAPADVLNAGGAEPTHGWWGYYRPYVQPILTIAGLLLSYWWISRWLEDRRFNAFVDADRSVTNSLPPAAKRD